VDGLRLRGSISISVYHIQTSRTVFHPENSAKKPHLSTIMIQRYGTAAHANVDTGCLLPLHALTTPLILHTNLHRRLRELLLRLALAVHLVLLAGRVATSVLGSAPSLNISINPPLHDRRSRGNPSYLLSRLLAVGGLHIQLVLFAGGVGRVGVLALGLAAGVS
jgi:hypothetical protein